MWPTSFCRFATAYLAATLQVNLLLSSVAAADPQEPGEHLKTSVLRLEGAKKARTQADTVDGRVREITWRLLVGELATDKSNGLSSAAFDALTRGLKELDELQAEIEKDPALERKLTDQPQLAMRLDATQARLTELAAKKDVSRADELARLSQLYLTREAMAHFRRSES